MKDVDSMIEVIGSAAGHIWSVLSRQEHPINITELSKVTKLKSQVTYQALGWLAREGKVEYHKVGTKTCVRLVNTV